MEKAKPKHAHEDKPNQTKPNQAEPESRRSEKPCLKPVLYGDGAIRVKTLLLYNYS